MQLVSPSGTSGFPQHDCLGVCFVCLCIRVTDRQLARVQGLTHDSSLNFPSPKSCKWGANYTVQSLSGHLDLESFGEPDNVEFTNFIKDKSAAAATRVSCSGGQNTLSTTF